MGHRLDRGYEHHQQQRALLSGSHGRASGFASSMSRARGFHKGDTHIVSIKPVGR